MMEHRRTNPGVGLVAKTADLGNGPGIQEGSSGLLAWAWVVKPFLGSLRATIWHVAKYPLQYLVLTLTSPEFEMNKLPRNSVSCRVEVATTYASIKLQAERLQVSRASAPLRQPFLSHS